MSSVQSANVLLSNVSLLLLLVKRREKFWENHVLIALKMFAVVLISTLIIYRKEGNHRVEIS
jgi:hypothetical protein